MRVVSSCAAGSPEFRLSSQAFLSDPDLNPGTVLPPGTLDRVGYECTTRLALVERLLKRGPADQAQACLGFYPSLYSDDGDEML